VSETVLTGGDLNVVVRVGDTVRRPTGPWSPAVHALLRHFEAVGFEGTPRVVGLDGDHELLTYVEGAAALAPVPAADEVVAGIGAFLRRMHDAQEGFAHGEHGPWQRMVGAPSTGDVVCHNDLFWTNLVFRDGALVGLVDWDLAAPAPRLFDLASAANFWVALRPDDQCEAWGVPCARRRERLGLLLDGYELPRAERPSLLEAIEQKTAAGLATYRRWGRDERRPGWTELWDRDRDRYLVARQDWLEARRAEVRTWLS
jgi:Ser/Thr protein kinase RdoA (MazF antagonist)